MVEDVTAIVVVVVVVVVVDALVIEGHMAGTIAPPFEGRGGIDFFAGVEEEAS